MTTTAPVTLPALTTATVAGTGVFDVLMAANKAHLEQEFAKNRVRGPEYATVYLGSLQAVLQNAVTFLLQKDKVALEADLISQQILLAQVQVQKANVELAILQAKLLNVPKEGVLLDKQAQELTQKIANAIIEGTVLTAQKCKLTAEFDVLILTKDKTIQETALLTWKTTTEKSQTLAAGVDDNSVVGKQKSLYGAQTSGFTRDAEQKAAKIMVDTWNTRRMTDEGTVANVSNQLDDATVGRAVGKLLAGVSA